MPRTKRQCMKCRWFRGFGVWASIFCIKVFVRGILSRDPQSGKLRIFDGIPCSLLNSCKNHSGISEIIPHGLSIVICEFEDCVCSQMRVAQVESCWLHNTTTSSNSSPNHDHTHPTCLQTSKLCPPFHSFVHQRKGLLLWKSQWCIGICLKTDFQTSAPRAYPTYYRTTVFHLLISEWAAWIWWFK